MKSLSIAVLIALAHGRRSGRRLEEETTTGTENEETKPEEKEPEVDPKLCVYNEENKE